MYAYKLMRILKNGDITSLFINKSKRIKLHRWMDAEDIPTSGYTRRLGFHALKTPYAPHLSTTRRGWFLVVIGDYEEQTRPASQGGAWMLAKKMCVLRQISDAEATKLNNIEKH